MEPTTCRTLAAPVVVRTEEKRSVFECWLRRVADAEAAQAVVEEARVAHPDAGHHCSALVLGPDAALVRGHDDGEPGGTAGMPMLETLTHAGVTDVVAVVSRWFGGTKLGTGGVVRAYSGAVRAALEQATLLTRVRMRELDVQVGHDVAGRLEHDLRARGVGIVDTAYGARVTLRLQVPVTDVDGLPDVLAELTGGAAEPLPGSEREAWVDRDWSPST